MEIDKTDGNLYALKEYMEEQDELELAYEYYISELNETIGKLVDDCIYQQRTIAKKYNIEHYDLIDYIKER